VATVREDGLWHVRGDVVDLRKCSFVPMVDDIQPAGIIHHMTIELGLDPKTRRIETLDVDQPQVAVEPSEASRGECCRDAGPRLTELAGETLDDGFPKRLGLHYGGALGCSHLLTLFQMMGNALPVALAREAAARAADGAKRRPGERPFRRAAFVDGFDREGGDIGLSAQMGDFDTRPASAAEGPLSRLARQHDVRVELTVAQGTRALGQLAAAERTRDSATLKSAPWRDRTSELADFEGAPIAPGLARRVFAALGGRDDRSEMRDLLLQLAPGYIQVLAAVSERFYGAAKPAGEPNELRASEAVKSVATGGGTEMLGGMVDSCWMWRANGPLHVTRASAEAARGAEPPKLPGAKQT
jgi:hypothetical protein